MSGAANRNSRGIRKLSPGFSLVEVMVALVVICVGLLGMAKMQALSLSGTNLARQRSMAAFLAAGLASTMNSNRIYWASAAAVAASNPAPITITSATGTITPATLAGVANNACIGGATVNPACPENVGTPGQTLAGFDLTRWSATVSPLLPNAVTTISCQGAIQPPSCIIQMTWTEQTVMTNNAAQNATGTGEVNAGQFQIPTYTLYVEP
jgi:type IV pilus assembly protein PilV